MGRKGRVCKRRPEARKWVLFCNLAAQVRAKHTGPNQQRSRARGPIGKAPLELGPRYKLYAVQWVRLYAHARRASRRLGRDGRGASHHPPQAQAQRPATPPPANQARSLHEKVPKAAPPARGSGIFQPSAVRRSQGRRIQAGERGCRRRKTPQSRKTAAVNAVRPYKYC